MDAKSMADHEEQQSAEGQASEPKGPKKAVIFGAVAGTVTLGTALGLMIVGPMIAGTPSDATHDTTAVAQADGDHGATSESGAGSVHVIDNMVLNPAMTNGARFLLVATAIEVSEPALVEELKIRDAESRDVLISVLGARTVEQLSDLAMRDSLRSQIAQAFNRMLDKPKAVRRVYFPQFVVQ
jgi:flagellar FliL protein